MVSHRPLNHNKLRTLFRASRILIMRGFQILFVKHRITWLVLAYGRIETKFYVYFFCVCVCYFSTVKKESFFHTSFSVLDVKGKKKSVFTVVLQDPALLEFAWVELLEKNKSVTTEELAEVYILCPNISISLPNAL